MVLSVGCQSDLTAVRQCADGQSSWLGNRVCTLLSVVVVCKGGWREVSLFSQLCGNVQCGYFPLLFLLIILSLSSHPLAFSLCRWLTEVWSCLLYWPASTFSLCVPSHLCFLWGCFYVLNFTLATLSVFLCTLAVSSLCFALSVSLIQGSVWVAMRKKWKEEDTTKSPLKTVFC